ncbi:SWF or SNF family helicase [Streptomyces sp. 549]|uniref:SWF or SNF family helicase n=1 Tax=Streptomyces sp. 549 TaxID=3049076 RepID=UPI0024C3D538|nr:SWF or SNF family helicase [Streptomyces sp. 549]MDK1474645.1 SWF or SNF family helicase [Streptomyces sp. 549]
MNAEDRSPSHESPPQERVRTYPALPPPPGRAFARSWWGVGWLTAWEASTLDTAALRAGRRLARSGAVGAVSVRPGRVTAVVHDRDGTGHRADVLLPPLPDGDWERLLDVVAGEAGHFAALLDGVLPATLAEDAQAAGVELLPGIGDTEAECGCGAWESCAHTAALGRQFARLLDQDPFALLLLRGRTADEVCADVQRRSAVPAGPASHDPSGPGEEAARVYARAAPAADWPDVPPVSEPGGTAGWDTDVPPPPEVDVEALAYLVADTARRAARLLAEARAPGHASAPVAEPLAEDADAVRLAAGGPGERVEHRLAAAGRRGTLELRRAVEAWQLGGAEALAVLDGTWQPEPAALGRAGAQLAGAWRDEEEQPVWNRSGSVWTAAAAGALVGAAGEAEAEAGVQLRYGPRGLWWPYRSRDGQWWPAGPPSKDPAAAVAESLAVPRSAVPTAHALRLSTGW